MARRFGIGQHRRVDVDDDLVALARSAGVEAVMEESLGEQGERVSLLLLHGGRSRGNVLRPAWRAPLPQVQRLAGSRLELLKGRPSAS